MKNIAYLTSLLSEEIFAIFNHSVHNKIHRGYVYGSKMGGSFDF